MHSEIDSLRDAAAALVKRAGEGRDELQVYRTWLVEFINYQEGQHEEAIKRLTTDHGLKMETIHQHLARIDRVLGIEVEGLREGEP